MPDAGENGGVEPWLEVFLQIEPVSAYVLKEFEPRPAKRNPR